jgi:hypothetical protein
MVIGKQIQEVISMAYYLTVNGVSEKFDNELAYYMKINNLRNDGYSIQYEKSDDNTCYATI